MSIYLNKEFHGRNKKEESRRVFDKLVKFAHKNFDIYGEKSTIPESCCFSLGCNKFRTIHGTMMKRLSLKDAKQFKSDLEKVLGKLYFRAEQKSKNIIQVFLSTKPIYC